MRCTLERLLTLHLLCNDIFVKCHGSALSKKSCQMFRIECVLLSLLKGYILHFPLSRRCPRWSSGGEGKGNLLILRQTIFHLTVTSYFPLLAPYWTCVLGYCPGWPTLTPSHEKPCCHVCISQ